MLQVLIYLDIDVVHVGETFPQHDLYLVYLFAHEARNAVGIIHAEPFERLKIVLHFFVLLTQLRLLERFLEKRGAVEFDFAFDAVNADAKNGRFEINNALYRGLRDKRGDYFFALALWNRAPEQV